MRLVYIEWVDSLGVGSDWRPLERIIAEPIICRSVGWVVAENEAVVVVVSHYHDADERRDVVLSGVGDMTIPRCAITRMSDLPQA